MSDESLFREVDEEVRQDQARKLWSRYGNVITAAALSLVLAVAGYKGWQYWQIRQSEAAAETFFSATTLIAEGKHDEGQKLLATIGHAGFAKLAKFRLAADLAQQGKTDDAVKLYDQLHADAGLRTSWRDLARVRAGYILADTLSPDELLKRLGDLDQESSPWRNPVREIVAISAYRTSNFMMADKYLNLILADREIQPGLRQRAQMMEQLLTPLLDKPPSQ